MEPTEKNMSKIITKAELQQKLGGRAQIVNVLDPKDYNLGLIKGSIKMPLSDLPARMSELNKSEEVITYCASSSCDASKKAASLLSQQGFNVSAYEGGIKEWKAAGLPM